ncbi:hypothetical protein ACHAXT_008691 [Thalassiosira profunda]
MATLQVAFAMVAALASTPALAAPSLDAPRLSLRQLRSASLPSDAPALDLHRLLHNSGGLLRLAAGDRYAALRRRALGHLCDCPAFDPGAFEDALQSHPQDLQQISLPDGAVRRTLASATVGFGGEEHNALELPSWVREGCGRAAHEAFEDLRDAVADAADAFVDALDGERGEGNGERQSYREVLSDTNHLEHFHVYTKGEDGKKIDGGDNGSTGHIGREEETATLDNHTDAGFFLSFVPAMDCVSRTTDNASFYLKGQSDPLSFGEDEIVIMMGAGAQYWLPAQDGKQEPFVAASHALRLSKNTHRTWYGKMHLLPASMTAIVEPSPSYPLKYGEALPAFNLNEHGAHVPSSPVDGCGTTAFNEDALSTLSAGSTTSGRGRRRRLQHASSPAACNNQTNFFCWRQCIDIPEAEHAEHYVNDGYSLYCLDPSNLSEDTSIKTATDPCQGGFVHNSNCIGSWQATDKEVPGYKLPYEAKETQQGGHDHSASQTMPDMEEKYCYGGTSMYMDGFNWQGTTCVIYLFQSWVLTTPGKFTLAALGSILFGILLEFVLWKRRTVYALPAGARRLCLSALVYGVQLTMGYFIMLVIMTYSAPLFISTVCGMVVGHVLFNAQDSLVKHKDEKKSRIESGGVSETARCEPIERTTTLSNNTELSSYQHSNGGYIDPDQVENGIGASLKSPPEEENLNESSTLRAAVADGVTPCCQYTV